MEHGNSDATEIGYIVLRPVSHKFGRLEIASQTKNNPTSSSHYQRDTMQYGQEANNVCNTRMYRMSHEDENVNMLQVPGSCIS